MDKNRLGTLCSGHKMDENGSKEFFKWKLMSYNSPNMSKTYTTYYGYKWVKIAQKYVKKFQKNFKLDINVLVDLNY